MSKSSSKEEIIAAIENQFSLLKQGKATIEDLELLVENTRELYERALVIRHKVYENQVLSKSEIVEESINTAEEVNIETEELTPIETVETEIQQNTLEKISSFEGIFSSNDDLFSPEEKPFDFDVFGEKKLIPQNIAENIDFDLNKEKTNSTEFKSDETLLNERLDLQIKDEIESEAVFSVEEENEEAVEQELVVENLESDFFETVEQGGEIADLDKGLNDSKLDEEKFPKENEIQNSERTNGNTIFDQILKQDDSLASRLMLTKLDTLIGAFGFNEKFQCIQELFKNSSEDFNQAIMILDNLQNFDEAKNQLEYYLHLYGWNLENEIVSEFVRKIERRFK